MNKELLKEYAELNALYQTLDEKREALRKQIVSELQAAGLERIEEKGIGAFKVSEKTTYKYTEAVDKLAEKVKLAKIKEEKSGVAVPSVTAYLTFKANV